MKNYITIKTFALASLFALGMTMQPLFGMQTKQEQLNEELLHAIELDNLGYIKASLEKGADINHKVPFTGMSPLHHAQTSPTADYLIKRGANVNSKDTVGLTPLHHSVINNNFLLTQCFIGNNADINSICIFFGTPLHQAAESDYSDAVKYLINQGADLTLTVTKDGTDKTAYDFAFDQKHTEIATYIKLINYYNQQKTLLTTKCQPLVQKKTLNKLHNQDFTDVLLVCNKQ